MNNKKTKDRQTENIYDDQYLLQQLQLHQAELEMQNDELRLANEQLELQRLKFAGIYDLAPIGYFILDPEGLIMEANTAGIGMLGTTKRKIIGNRLQSFAPGDYANRYHRFFRELLRSRVKQSCILRLTSGSAHDIYVQLEGIAVKPADSLPLQCDIAMIDITERVKTEKNLSKTKERLELALEASASGTWEFEPETMRFYLDEFNYQTFAIEGGKFDGHFQTFIQLIHPDDQATVDLHFRQSLSQQREIDIVCRFINRGGHICYASIRGHIIQEEGHPTRFIGIMTDITEKRRIEDEAAQLKHNQRKDIALATLAAEENERKRISDALHDGVSQLLYGIRIRLAGLETEGNIAEMRSVNQLLDAAIEETRNLSFELAPAILADFGLQAALDELAGRLSTEKMLISTQVRGFSDRLDLQLETGIFRIIQELVNNAMKHSGATQVKIIVNRNKLIELNVSDNGKGFQAQDPSQVPAGAGLTSIRNRVNLYNGNLQIDSQPDRGTIVTATLNDETPERRVL